MVTVFCKESIDNSGVTDSMVKINDLFPSLVLLSIGTISTYSVPYPSVKEISLFNILKSSPSTAGAAMPSVETPTVAVTLVPPGTPASMIGILIASVAFSSSEADDTSKLTNVSSGLKDTG